MTQRTPEERIPWEQVICHYRGAPMDMYHGICACGVHVVPGKVKATASPEIVDCEKCLQYINRYVVRNVP